MINFAKANPIANLPWALRFVRALATHPTLGRNSDTSGTLAGVVVMLCARPVAESTPFLVDDGASIILRNAGEYARVLVVSPPRSRA